MLCCVDWVAVDCLSQRNVVASTRGRCGRCRSARLPSADTVLSFMTDVYHFCSCLQINLYYVGVRLQLRLAISLFACLKLAEFANECHILSTVDNLSEVLLMPTVLKINATEQSPS
jgi:hypothetical protein